MNQRLKIFLQLMAVLIVTAFLTCNTQYGEALLEHGIQTYEAGKSK